MNETELAQENSPPPKIIEPEQDSEYESEIDPDISAIAGVETNVNSRFIDYSIATPWEDLIASIERGNCRITAQKLHICIIHILIFRAHVQFCALGNHTCSSSHQRRVRAPPPPLVLTWTIKERN
jgi:hypothetical protein